jgi:hypothetical protein
VDVCFQNCKDFEERISGSTPRSRGPFFSFHNYLQSQSSSRLHGASLPFSYHRFPDQIRLYPLFPFPPEHPPVRRKTPGTSPPITASHIIPLSPSRNATHQIRSNRPSPGSDSLSLPGLIPRGLLPQLHRQKGDFSGCYGMGSEYPWQGQCGWRGTTSRADEIGRFRQGMERLMTFYFGFVLVFGGADLVVAWV